MKALDFNSSEVASYYRTRFPDLKQSGPEWRGPCPVHQGDDANFAVKPRKRTGVLSLAVRPRVEHPPIGAATFSAPMERVSPGGEPRLLDQLRQARELPVEQVVTAIFNTVQGFSAGNQSDDLTLVIARAR